MLPTTPPLTEPPITTINQTPAHTTTIAAQPPITITDVSITPSGSNTAGETVWSVLLL